ncbi:MAG: penicillin-binding protein 2 [Alphaproteobacteria bacterium]|nr:penicillin-binding protein 2 [Alphaproteobacteria bacterium]
MRAREKRRVRKEADNTKVFSRRALFIGALQMSALAVLGGRLAWLQVAQGQRYKRLSDKNRISVKMLAPVRGEIVDRFGVPLAVNNRSFRVLVIPEQAGDLQISLRALQKVIDLDEERIEDVLARAKKTAKFAPIEVKDGLTWEEVARIEVRLPDLPGLFTDTGQIRSYPFGVATAHVIGYVGAVSKEELGEDPVLSLPGFKIGKTGIEKRYDREMRGEAGASEVEVNVVGREVRELKRTAPKPGKRVMLTLDGELQRFTQEKLAERRSASAVVLDAQTGAVYALASYPAFDPNVFTHNLSIPMWEELLADPGHPLTNKALAGQYPPASTFKMITALAGLKAGKITRDRRVYCSGHYQYGDDRFHCWKAVGHGYMNVIEALMESCDTYFYELSTEIGIENIAAMARELGLGERFGFELSEEQPGLVPDKNWKMGHLGEVWRPGDTIVNSIGQGQLLATPLQLAVMTARMVNGGYAVKPWIAGLVGEQERERENWPKIEMHKGHLALVKEGMDRVVNDRKGTAYSSRIEDPAMAMGGKTGTAQVRKITMAQRMAGIKNEELVWKSRHHGLFVGYAPLKEPRYVTAVVVEHGVGGSISAAPVAHDLLLETQKRNPAAKILAASAAE